MDTIRVGHPQISIHIHTRALPISCGPKTIRGLFSRVMPPVSDFLPPGWDYPLELGLWFCGEKKIRDLNGDFRHIRRKTDVLAFPLYDSMHNSHFLGCPLVNLGDIFICVPVAQKRAASFGISFEEEVIHLFIHGLLHLVGYDHEASPEEERRMALKEEKLLARSYGQLGWRYR